VEQELPRLIGKPTGESRPTPAHEGGAQSAGG
jgi:hypothetical protein